MRSVMAVVLGVMLLAGCASAPPAPAGVAGTQAASIQDEVQKQKDDLDRFIGGSVNIVGPKNLLDMVHLANSLNHHGMIVFHVVTTQVMAERHLASTEQYAQALRTKVVPTLNKVETMSVRVEVEKLSDKELIVFWAVIDRVMLDQNQNEEFDAFFKALE